ncbi:MAG: helix-turn-helix domain-containing protein [Acidimicrobiia bacterium]
MAQDADLIALSDASALLGVSVERVRQLVVAGELPGRRFGNVWVVARDAIAARRHSPGVRGRPLEAARAWNEIVAGRVDLERAGRYRRRAEVVRAAMSEADAAALPALAGARISGGRGAIEHGELLSDAVGWDIYVPRSGYERLGANVAFVPDSFGNVVLRVVDDDVWAELPPAPVAPPGAVALDLLESGDPRLWIAAEHLAARHG